MTQHLDLDALQAAADEFDTFINEPPSYEQERMVREYRHDAYPKWAKVERGLRDAIDRLRKAEATSMSGHVIVPAEQFLAVLDRSDWRTAKNRAELRAMIAAPDRAPTDSADSEGAKG